MCDEEDERVVCDKQLIRRRLGGQSRQIAQHTILPVLHSNQDWRGLGYFANEQRSVFIHDDEEEWVISDALRRTTLRHNH